MKKLISLIVCGTFFVSVTASAMVKHLPIVKQWNTVAGVVTFDSDNHCEMIPNDSVCFTVKHFIDEPGIGHTLCKTCHAKHNISTLCTDCHKFVDNRTQTK